MSMIENPQIKAVRHFEKEIDTKNPAIHKNIYDWVTSILNNSPRLEKNCLYQGDQTYIIDRVRNFPYIGEASYFFRSGFRKISSDKPLSQYQTDGQWNHEECTLESLKKAIDIRGNNIESYINLAIEMFGKSGNIRGLTNLFHYAEELNLSIPPHIQIEALFWAEVCLAKSLLEQENVSGFKKVIRASDVKKKDEEQKFVGKDPILHLFRAYRLTKMLESILTGQINQ